MKFTILTLFPEMFAGVFSTSIIKRAIKKGLVKIRFANFREFATDKHHTVDDKPYGGGVGMILKVEPIYTALRRIKKNTRDKTHSVLLTPQGKTFDQKTAKRLTRYDQLILVCGHYEGVDERIAKLVDEQISIGDYILTGGEVPAMVVVDAITRLLPGVLSKKEATQNESFRLFRPPSSPPATPKPARQAPDGSSRRADGRSDGGRGVLRYQLLEPPQYTRPADFQKMKVPAVLLSGNHKKIQEWRLREAWKKTKRTRPDLLKSN